MLNSLDYQMHVEWCRRMLFGKLSPENIAVAELTAQRHHAAAVHDGLTKMAAMVSEFQQFLSEQQSKYYITYGAGRRLLIIEGAFISIIRMLPVSRTQPLSLDEQRTANNDCNSVYMHLRGVLDNLAWCILYEKFPKAAEKASPMRVALFSSELKQPLTALGISDEIYKHEGWMKEVKERRDPVAHRIPLYVPPAQLTSVEAERYLELHSRWNDTFNKLITEPDIGGSITEWEEELRDINEEMQTIGAFSPCFQHHPDEARIPIYPTIPSDVAHLIQITRTVMRALGPPTLSL